MTLRPAPSLPARHLDKVVHFFAYAALAMFMQFSLRKSGASAPTSRFAGKRSVILASMLTIAVGAFDESFQFFSPYRTASLFDLLADALGAVAGSLMMNFLLHFRYKRHGKAD